MTENPHSKESFRKSSNVSGDEYRMRKVFELIEMNENCFSSCEGKNVIVLMGKTQAGKSVTINALHFGCLTKTRLGKDRYKFDLPSGCEAGEGAETGDGMGSCTKLPAGYVYGEDTVLLDTRGFFDTTMTPIDEAAASVLMELVLRKAKSVKLVLLQRCSEFFSGLIGMQLLGEVFGKVVTCDDVPVMYLFNDYKPDDIDEMQKMMAMKPDEKQKYIMDRLVKDFSVVEKGAQKNIDALVKRLETEYKEQFGDDEENPASVREFITSSECFKKAENDRRYLRGMSMAFKGESGSVMYIDPTDEYSITMLREALPKLECVDMKFVTFTQYNDDVSAFRRHLALSLEKYWCLLKGRQLMVKYPSKMIENLISNRKQLLEKHQTSLQLIERDGHDVSLLSKYEEEYGEEALEGRVSSLEKEAELLMKEYEELKSAAEEVETADPVVYDKISWRQLSYCSTQKIKYKKDVPFVDYKEELVPPTHVYKVHALKKGTTQFDVDYAAGHWLEAGLSFVLGVFGYITGRSQAESAREVFHAAKTMSEGTVEFLVNPIDIPENAERVRSLKEQALDRKRQADTKEAQVQELVKASQLGLKEKVKGIIDLLEHELSLLNNFLAFSSKFEILFEKQEKDLERYFAVLKKLYPDESRNIEPLMLFNELHMGNIQPESEISDLSVLDIQLLLEQLGRNFDF